MFRPVPAVLAAAFGWLLGAAGPAAAQQLGEMKLDEIKRATVLVKVSNGEVGGSGSGFLVRVIEKSTGYVVTNYHVINMKEGRKTHHKPTEPWEELIEVVFNSGTRDEYSRQAYVVAEDPERDLAILRVGLGHNAPKPIDLNSPPKLVETTPVLVCGFPYGGMLATNFRNPAITIGKATISSIRTNNVGDPVYIQLDGQVNPGNSGGPIVTADGKLVGVAVMAIHGAGIGLAIPHHEVTTMLGGRLGAAELFAAPVDRDTMQIKIEVPLIDPFRNVNRVRLYWALAKSGARPPKTDKQGRWLKIPDAEEIELPVKHGWAVSSIRVPREGKPSLWLQLEFVTHRGGKFLLGTTEHTLPIFKVTDGPQDGVYMTANRVGDDDRVGAKGGGITLKDLHTRPDRFVGTKVTFDAVLGGIAKRADALTEMVVLFETKTKVGGVRFTTPTSLADQYEKAVGKEFPPTKARLVGTVYAPEGKDGKCTLEIDEIRLLGEDGEVTSSMKPVASAGPPVVKSEPKPETPAATKPAEPEASADEGDELPLPMVAGGGLLLCGGVLAVVFMSKRGGRPAQPASFPARPPSAERPPSSNGETPAAEPPPAPARREPTRRVRF